MPNLPVYDSPAASRGLQPSSRGIDAVEMEGRAWNSAMNEIGGTVAKVGNKIEAHYAQKDATDLAKESTDAFADLTDSWNKAAAGSDPNDPETAAKWRDEVLEPYLEKIGANVSSKHGEQEAEDTRNRLRQHFTEKTIADQNDMAGLAVQTNLDNAVNRLGNAVRNDPSALDSAIGILDTAISSQVKAHNLDAVTAAKIRTELFQKGANGIAQSALFGLAESNPEAAQKALSDGAFDKYFTPQQKETAEKLVANQVKLNTTLIEKQNKDTAEAEAAAIQATTVTETGDLTIPKDYFFNVGQWIAKNAAKPGAQGTASTMGRALMDYGRSIQRELAEGTPSMTDPHTYDDLSSRLTLPATDPRAITDEQIIRARADGFLSDKDYNFFRGAVATLNRDPAYRYANARFNEFLSGIKSSITRSNILLGANDPTGDQKFLQFKQAARDAFERAYRAGGNWTDLLDRNGANSLWKAAVPYMTDQKGAMQGLQDRVNGTVGLVPSVNAPKRNPGESPDAFLKRLGGQ